MVRYEVNSNNGFCGQMVASGTMIEAAPTREGPVSPSLFSSDRIAV
jgi:hypothetical protein